MYSHSNFNPLLNPDLLYESLKHLDYHSIRQVCSSDKNIYLMCATNPLITKLIRQRRIEHKTNRFLRHSIKDNKIAEASGLGDTEIVDELIKRGFDPTKDYNNAIVIASGHGHLAVVNRLLEDNRVNPGAQDNYAIIYASAAGKLSVANRLLHDERVKPNAQANLAIQWASKNRHIAVVNRLLQDVRVRESLSPEELQKYLQEIS